MKRRRERKKIERREGEGPCARRRWVGRAKSRKGERESTRNSREGEGMARATANGGEEEKEKEENEGRRIWKELKIGRKGGRRRSMREERRSGKGEG